MLGGPATHNMLFGGSRSGKTFTICRALAIRATAVEKSRHAALRYRFNHIKASVVYDTMPKMMDLCFPGLWERCRLDKTDWFLEFPNGSEIWFGGLDDKERTEKILGQEYASMFLNECSQIPWASRNMAVTRLAQNVEGLRLKMYYDCNPPSEAHWTYRVFHKGQSPDTKGPLANPHNYHAMQMNPEHNRDNLPDGYFTELESLPERQRRRFLLGLFSDESDGQLWTYELLDQQRRLDDSDLPTMQRIIIAVDPSGCRGEEDYRSDEIGIVVCGLGTDQRGYILEDLSGKYGATGAENWGRIVVGAYRRWRADRVIGESNYGGDMVKAVIQAATEDGETIPYGEVKASRGKVVRADPIAALYETGKVFHVGRFPELEDQMVGFTVGGYIGSNSPDRADAAIWGLTHLFPKISRSSEDNPEARRAEPRVVHSKRMGQMRRRR